jgi:hypothetical protein
VKTCRSARHATPTAILGSIYSLAASARFAGILLMMGVAGFLTWYNRQRRHRGKYEL